MRPVYCLFSLFEPIPRTLRRLIRSMHFNETNKWRALVLKGFFGIKRRSSDCIALNNKIHERSVTWVKFQEFPSKPSSTINDKKRWGNSRPNYRHSLCFNFIKTCLMTNEGEIVSFIFDLKAKKIKFDSRQTTLNIQKGFLLLNLNQRWKSFTVRRLKYKIKQLKIKLILLDFLLCKHCLGWFKSSPEFKEKTFIRVEWNFTEIDSFFNDFFKSY